MGQQLKELLRLQNAITIGVANLEQLLQVSLKHVSRHFVPHWHTLANIWSKVLFIHGCSQAHHGWHKLLVLNHTILVHISSLDHLNDHVIREVEARAAQQLSKLNWRKHTIIVAVSNLEQLLQVISHHVSWHISWVWHGKLLSSCSGNAVLHGSNHSKHRWHELVILNHAIVVGVSLQEKLQHQVGWESQTSTGQQLKELHRLQNAITID